MILKHLKSNWRPVKKLYTLNKEIWKYAREHPQEVEEATKRLPYSINHASIKMLQDTLNDRCACALLGLPRQNQFSEKAKILGSVLMSPNKFPDYIEERIKSFNKIYGKLWEKYS